MIDRLRHLWHHQRIGLLAFGIAVAAMGYFGVRTLSAAIYWMDPAHQDQPLADWMTPRYVGQSYHLPREVIEEVFFLERGKEPPRVRLKDIMDEQDMTMEALQARLDAAKAAFEADREARRSE